jgi:hypothetical protein
MRPYFRILAFGVSPCAIGNAQSSSNEATNAPLSSFVKAQAACEILRGMKISASELQSTTTGAEVETVEQICAASMTTQGNRSTQRIPEYCKGNS